MILKIDDDQNNLQYNTQLKAGAGDAVLLDSASWKKSSQAMACEMKVSGQQSDAASLGVDMSLAGHVESNAFYCSSWGCPSIATLSTIPARGLKQAPVDFRYLMCFCVRVKRKQYDDIWERFACF